MLVTYCEDFHQLQTAKENGIQNIILAHKDFSMFGTLNDENFLDLLSKAHDLELKVSFEWDILISENDFSYLTDKFLELNLIGIDAIRAKDLGVLNFVYKKTDFNIHLISEGHNHNLHSLKQYEAYFKERLTRVILSIELPREKLRQYKSELSCDVEFLVLGRILLFYTPRSLLSPLSSQPRSEYYSAQGESEESPHKGFPLIENKHGTFMFHIKHQYLLDYLSELDFIDYLRVDLRFDSDFSFIGEILNVAKNKELATEFKANYPFDTIRGFYKVNKSNVLFKKLKNQKVQRKDVDYLGEVIEAQKPSHIVLHIKSKKKLRKGDTLKFINPEGKEYELEAQEVKGLNNNIIDSASFGDYVKLKYHSHLWVKSQAYL